MHSPASLTSVVVSPEFRIPASTTLTEAARALIHSEKYSRTTRGEWSNALCPGLEHSCRPTLSLHECAAFIPVTRSGAHIFTWLIRFRTQTTIRSRERSIQPVVTGCSAAKKATSVGEVGFACSNRRWSFTNSSPITMLQVRHSMSGTRLDPLFVLRWESQTLVEDDVLWVGTARCSNLVRLTVLYTIITRPGPMTRKLN
jgi:hypothetical protein